MPDRMLQALLEHVLEQCSPFLNRAMHVRTHVLTESYSPSSSLLTLVIARRGQRNMPDRYGEMVETSECELCDDDGIRLNGLHRCDHIDYGLIAKRGWARVRAALKGE
jgi:hypothetical protein